MTPEEAREKFGKEVRRDNGEVVWQPHPNKVRGMLLSYARMRDNIPSKFEEPQASEYIEGVWEWLRAKLGDGFGAIFQTHEPSPSGRFDRIGKDNLERFADGFYENNEEFRSLIDEAWDYRDDDNSVSSGSDTEENIKPRNDTLFGLEDTSPKNIIEKFFEQPDDYDEDSMLPQKGDPLPSAYKGFMKRYAMRTDRISSDVTSPDAEAFVDAFLDVMIEDYINEEGAIVIYDGSRYGECFSSPYHHEVVEWVREMWQEDDEFKRNVMEKWNKEVVDGEEDGEGESRLSKVGASNKTGNKGKRGQQSLGDFQ